MTVFDDAMADIAGDTDMGTAAVFTAAGYDPVTVSVNYEIEVDPQPDLTGSAWTEYQTIEALLSDLGRTPTKGDTFTIGTTVYTVFRVLENDQVWVKVAVK